MARSVEITFDGEMSALRRDLQGMQSHMKGWGNAIKAIGVAAFAGWISKQCLQNMGGWIELANEQIQAETKLASVLRATGGAAGFSAEELKKMASDLQSVTTFGDEVIINMQAVLATFKEVKGDEFERATKAALDMSAVLGTGLQGAAIQLGKSLNDPTVGMSALTRSGVSFTQQQKEMVKAMQESGDIAGAQNIILAEMEAQFGGAAEAAANASGGGLQQLKNQFGDIKEILGSVLLEQLDAMTPALKGIADNAQEAAMQLGGVVTFAREAYEEVVKFNTGAITAFMVGFENIGTVVGIAWDSIKLGAIGLYEDFKHIFTVQIPEVASWFAENWRDVFSAIANFTETVFSNMFGNVKEFFQAVASWLKGDGFDWEWTSLTKGLEITLKELPNIVGRELTATEAALQASVAKQGLELGMTFAERYKFALESLGFDRDEVDPKSPMVPAAAIAAGGAAAVVAVDDAAGGKAKEEKRSQARFEDFSSLFNRIQGSAATAGQLPEVRAAEKGAMAAERGAKAGETAISVLKRIDANTRHDRPQGLL